jgi:hypothetical protein
MCVHVVLCSGGCLQVRLSACREDTRMLFSERTVERRRHVVARTYKLVIFANFQHVPHNLSQKSGERASQKRLTGADERNDKVGGR